MAGLSLLQWNIGNFDVGLRLPGRGHGGMSYTLATASREEDLEDLAAVIRAEAPDFVTLQEVDVRKDHHRRLAELTGCELAVFGTPDDRHTQAILIKAGVAELLGPLQAPAPVNGVGARVRLKKAGLELAVFSNHSEAGIHTKERVAQHSALAAWSRELSRGVSFLMGGDFNFDDAPGSLHHGAERLRAVLPFVPSVVSSDWDADCESLDALKKTLRDLGEKSGFTSGAPRLWPRILLPFGFPLIPLGWALGAGRRRSRLDYVFGSRPARTLDSKVLRVTGPKASGHAAAAAGAFPWMDHDPVVVRFRLEDEGV